MEFQPGDTKNKLPTSALTVLALVGSNHVLLCSQTVVITKVRLSDSLPRPCP